MAAEILPLSQGTRTETGKDQDKPQKMVVENPSRKRMYEQATPPPSRPTAWGPVRGACGDRHAGYHCPLPVRKECDIVLLTHLPF